MAKEKYHFDHKSLSYKKVKSTIKGRLLKIGSVLGSSVVFAVVFLVIFYNVVDSPKERLLKREVKQYETQLKLINNRLKQMSSILEDLESRDDNIYRVIFETEPIPSTVRKGGFGGVDKYAKLEGYKNSDLVIETSKNLDLIARRLYVQSKSFDDVFNLAKNKNQMLLSIPAIQPISDAYKRICSGFGYRLHPIYKTLHMHTGIDFMAARGTPIYATGDGTVISPTGNESGYGTVCLINHGFGYVTLYGHMSKMIVRPGEKIKRGQTVGYVGSTGLSTAPHLHYEVIKNGIKINPINYFFNDLTPKEFEMLRDAASRVNQALS